MKYKLMLLMLFSIASFTSVAAPTPAEERQVVGYADQDGKLFNTYLIYGSVMSYYIPESDYTLVINAKDDDGQTVRVDIDYPEYVIEAMREWGSVGMSYNRQFGVSVDPNTVLIGTINNNDNSLGGTVFNPHGGNTRLSINRGAFNSVGLKNYAKLKQRGAIPADMSKEDYLRLLVRVTLKHEFGHVLGLLHNNEDGVHFPYGEGVNVSNCTIRNQPPSIMLNGSNYSYINQLSLSLGRPVTVNDIGPSASDIAGARTMYNRGSRNFLTRLSCLGALSSLGSAGSDL